MLTTDVLNFYFKRIPVSSGKRECSEATIFKKIALANVVKFLSLPCTTCLSVWTEETPTWTSFPPPPPPKLSFSRGFDRINYTSDFNLGLTTKLTESIKFLFKQWCCDAEIFNSLPKVMRVCIALFYFALWMVKKIRPLSRSIRSETETSNGHDLIARVFSLFWEFGFFLTLSLFSLALKGSFLSSAWLFWLLQTISPPVCLYVALTPSPIQPLYSKSGWEIGYRHTNG